MRALKLIYRQLDNTSPTRKVASFNPLISHRKMIKSRPIKK